MKHLIALLLFAAAAHAAGRTPVLLELFTSEGCDSCPPADRLLEKLDREQPYPQADLIVLSEHVDYWNHLGWSDPYSSVALSQRQRDYAARLHSDDVYTPQLIVDGANYFVGSNADAAREAIAEAARAPKLALTLAAHREGSEAALHIVVPSAPGKNLFIALAADRAVTQVRAGENSGRRLAHVAVAYDIHKLAKLSDQVLDKDIRVHLRDTTPTRLVVFVQDGTTGRITAAAQAKL